MAQTIFGLNAFKQRIAVYMMGKFDFVQMLEYTQKFRITFLVLVPPVVVLMAKDPRTREYDLSSVERIGCGAAPLGREVCVELEKLWPPGTMNIKQVGLHAFIFLLLVDWSLCFANHFRPPRRDGE
jgi:4-coumarate--CoA ligase